MASLAPPQPLDHRKRRRNRTTQSCMSCHLNKRKCDRQRPCQRCTNLGSTALCVYEVDDKSRLVPGQDEVSHLRSRVAELEAVIREIKKTPEPRWAAQARLHQSTGDAFPSADNWQSRTRRGAVKKRKLDDHGHDHDHDPRPSVRVKTEDSDSARDPCLHSPSPDHQHYHSHSNESAPYDTTVPSPTDTLADLRIITQLPADIRDSSSSSYSSASSYSPHVPDDFSCPCRDNVMASSLVATLVKDLSHSVDYFNRLHPRQPCSLHRVLSEFESRLAPHTEVSYSPAESATLYQPLDSDSQSHSSSPHSVPSPPLPSTTTAPHIASHAFHAMYTAAWDVAETVVLPLSHYSSLDAACRRYDDHLYGPQTVDAECTSYAA